MERKWYPLMDNFYSDVYKKLEGKGIKYIKFSSEDEKWFLDTIDSESWKWVINQDPVNGPRLKERLAK
jgi:hypothetical protein